MEARPGGLPAAVAEIGRRLAAMLGAHGEPPAGTPARVSGVAARTTSSPAALDAYLEGVRRFRAFHPDSAIAALREAVALDSTFALAAFRLAMTAEIRGGSASWRLADSAAALASRHVGRLPERDRRLMQAFGHLRAGRARAAELELREFVSAHPDDFEAWYLLGEVQHRYSVVRGLPPAGAEGFRRVLEMDPDFRPALWHLRLEALSQGRIAEFDSLTRRFLSVAREAGATRTASPAGDGSFRDLEIRYARLARADHRLVELLRAEDEPARERWFAELAAAGDVELAWLVGIHIEYLSWPGRERDAARAARLLTDPDRPVWQRANGFVSLGSLALREGRWREARAQLDSLAAIDPVRAALWRADWASSSFLPLPAAELRSIHSELATILEMADVRPPEGLPVGPVGWTTTPPAGPEVGDWPGSRR